MAGFFKRLISKFQKKHPDLHQTITDQNRQQVNKVLTDPASQEKFNASLKKSATVFSSHIQALSAQFKQVDQAFVEQLEETLIGFDMGPVVTQDLVEKIVAEIKYHNVIAPHLIKQIIVDQIFIYYIQDSCINTGLNLVKGRVNVVVMMGANGVGKTTTIAKLAHLLTQLGYRVLLVAGDSFRAGAIEQLSVWAKRLGLAIVTPKKYGQDPSSVIYQGIERGQKEQYDVVLCDTSGRLENKQNLMLELQKIHKTIQKLIPDAPHETLLVLDATIGQSGLRQAEVFHQMMQVSGIVLTKVDSTSYGGIIFAIKNALNLPVKYIGLGEGLDDLSTFDLERVVDSLTHQLGV